MWILIIFTFVIDFLISYFIPVSFNNLNYFYPMLVIVLIVYLFEKILTKNYLKTIFCIGIIYDIFYSYIFLLNALIFLLFGKIVKKVYKYLRNNFIINLLLIIVLIFLYDLILFVLMYITNNNLVSFYDLIYKFKNSIILNIIYYCLLKIILKNVKFKH